MSPRDHPEVKHGTELLPVRPVEQDGTVPVGAESCMDFAWMRRLEERDMANDIRADSIIVASTLGTEFNLDGNTF